MKVEIWSDITCPSCYTGKRKFEEALANFEHKDSIEIIYKSFELAPGFETNPSIKLPQFLAEMHKVSLVQADSMIAQVEASAKEVGLNFNLRIAIPANSIKAHLISHLAKKHNLQEQAEEKFLNAYFTKGKNIDDNDVLLEIATGIGLNKEDARATLTDNKSLNAVKSDIAEAKARKINSIPHFLFNSSTSISGAQESKTFIDTLNKSFNDWSNQKPSDAAVCEIGKPCL